MFNSLINKMKTFPLYHDTQESLNKIFEQEEIICKSYEAAFGPDFDKFISNQPAEVKDAFTSIQQNERECTKNLRNSQVETGVVANDFSAFLNFYVQKGQLNRQLQSKRDTLQEVTNDKEKKLAVLEKERSRGQGDAFANAQMSYDKAETAYNNATNVLNETEKKIEEEQQKLQNSIGLHFAHEMSRLVKSRRALIEKNIQTAQSIKESVSHFQNFNDPLIPKLQERLQLWETDPK